MRKDSATRFGGGALAVTAALVFASAAAADEPPAPPPLPGDAAIYEYRESLPTGAGNVAPAVDRVQTRPLSPALRTLVRSEGGTDAAMLERVATSSALGAPQRIVNAGPRHRPTPERAGRAKRRRDTGSSSAFAAAVRSASADVRSLGLFGTMVLVATIAVRARGPRQGTR